MKRYCNYIEGFCFETEKECRKVPAIVCHNRAMKIQKEKEIEMNRIDACLKLHSVAKAELGIHETAGAAATERILEYAEHTTLKATSDEVPWCSAFANFVVDTTGFTGTKSAAARSWLNWGVPLAEPILGCVVVLDRHDAGNPLAAHVTFCDHPDISNGIIRCIGGNQGDAVKVSRYSTDKVLGYRAPIQKGVENE